MRSLITKLVLAFLLISVAGLILAGFFIRRSVTNEFDDFLLTQQRTSFINTVGNYYEYYGTWENVNLWLRDLPKRPEGFKGGKGGPERYLHFVLADAEGNIVIPYGEYQSGNQISTTDRTNAEVLTSNGQTVGYVITPKLDIPLNPEEERYLQRTMWGLGMAGIIAVTFALIFGIVLARLMTRPLRELTEATERIASGHLEQQVPVRSRDEIGMLATQFNRMSADLARSHQLRHQMTADIAHDLRTPLTVLSGYMEAMRDDVLKPTPARFSTMYDETQLLLHLVEDLHTLSLADAGELPSNRRSLDPRSLVERVAATYHHIGEQQGVTINAVSPESMPQINVDAEQMARVLNNLVSNALRYTPAGGSVTVSTQTVGDRVELRVSDTGSGIEPEHLPNIFERFYRADSSRHEHTGGSGLGLTIVKSIVEFHGGTIKAESTLGHGTTFIISLPTM